MRAALFMWVFNSIFFVSCLERGKEIKELHLEKTKLTEEEIRKIFIDSTTHLLEYWPGMYSFLKQHYPDIVNTTGLNNKIIQIIYALEEDFFNEHAVSYNRNLIRLIYQPAFSNPYSIKLEQKNGRTYLSTKVLSGKGAYYSGYLSSSYTRVLPGEVYKKYLKMFEDMNFWELNDDTSCLGFDGT